MSLGLSVISVLKDIIYFVDIPVQMNAAFFTKSSDGRAMLQLTDDLPTIRSMYFWGTSIFDKSLVICIDRRSSRQGGEIKDMSL
jgi:hypothetical protein